MVTVLVVISSYERDRETDGLVAMHKAASNERATIIMLRVHCTKQTEFHQRNRVIGDWARGIPWPHTTTTTTTTMVRWLCWPITAVRTTACRCSPVTTTSLRRFPPLTSPTKFSPARGTSTLFRRLCHQVDNQPTSSSRQPVCRPHDNFRSLSMTSFPPESGPGTTTVATSRACPTVLDGSASTRAFPFPVRRRHRSAHTRWLETLLRRRWLFTRCRRHRGSTDSRFRATAHAQNTGCRVSTWSPTLHPASVAGPAFLTSTTCCGAKSLLSLCKAYKL